MQIIADKGDTIADIILHITVYLYLSSYLCLNVQKLYAGWKRNTIHINIINFLSIPKPHQKFIPFKELSNRLEIDTNQISNYITNILNNGTHKKTIRKSFDTLQTIPKEICISKF